MSRCCRTCFCLVVVFLAPLLAAAQVPPDFHPSITLLESPNVVGRLTEAHVVEALWYAASDLRVPANQLPRIVVIHASLDAAHVALPPTAGWNQVGKTGGVVLNEDTSEGTLFYVWVVGPPSDEILVRGMVTILKGQTGLPEDQVASVAHRVLLRMKAVVRARDYQSG